MTRFGLVGSGKIAREHAKVIEFSGHTLSAVTSRNQSGNLGAFAKEFKVSAKYNSISSMIENSEIEALIVCVSWDQVKDILPFILESHLPTLVEKPIALEVKDLDSLIENYGADLARVQVGYNRRFYDFIPKIYELIKSGELISITIETSEDLVRLEKRYSPKIRENLLVYSISHLLDLVFYLVGPLTIIERRDLKSKYSSSPVGLSAIFDTKGNVPVYFYSTWGNMRVSTIRFDFLEESIVLGPIEKCTSYGPLLNIEATEEMPIGRKVPVIRWETTTDLTFKPGFVNQLNHFVDSLVEKRCVQDRGCTIFEARIITSLCQALK